MRNQIEEKGDDSDDSENENSQSLQNSMMQAGKEPVDDPKTQI